MRVREPVSNAEMRSHVGRWGHGCEYTLGRPNRSTSSPDGDKSPITHVNIDIALRCENSLAAGEKRGLV